MGNTSVTETLEQRYSCRAYTGQPVTQKVLEQLLLKAGMSPSGGECSAMASACTWTEEKRRANKCH